MNFAFVEVNLKLHKLRKFNEYRTPQLLYFSPLPVKAQDALQRLEKLLVHHDSVRRIEEVLMGSKLSGAGKPFCFPLFGLCFRIALRMLER